ncbi:MAG: hypothetical protein HY650_14405 [Acidobacteria bacterium]|nr:hypothetical protein [Acidobacteriota bacterium]
MSEEGKSEQSREWVNEFWEGLGQLARETSFPLPPKLQPSDSETYAKVTAYLKSEIKQGRIRILVYPQGDGKFSFFLAEREPHLADAAGNLPELGLPLNRVNEIINREILVNLHSAYWNTPGEMVRIWTPIGQAEESLSRKYDVTKELLTDDLIERVTLARSLTASSLVFSGHEIHMREIQGRSGSVETLRSALVKLIIRENFSPQPSVPTTSVAFDLTLGEVRDLIEDLRVIERKLQSQAGLHEGEDPGAPTSHG